MLHIYKYWKYFDSAILRNQANTSFVISLDSSDALEIIFISNKQFGILMYVFLKN